MDRALLLLLKLQAKGALRRLVRGIRSPRGAILLSISIFFIVLWMMPSVYMAMTTGRTNPANVERYAPLSLLAFCVVTLLTSAGERAVAFGPAEIDFLFPAPLTRKQLLGYKLIKSAAIAAITSLIFSLILMRHATHWIACYLGVFLGLIFVQLLSMTVVLLGEILGARAYSRSRKIVGVALLVLIALAAMPAIVAALPRDQSINLPRLADAIYGSRLGSVLVAPFIPFGRLLATQALWPNGPLWFAISLAVDAALVLVVIQLDANYLESSLVASQQIHKRIARWRRGGLNVTVRANASRHLPMFPAFKGAGPIAWRQFTNALRTSRGLIVVVIILALVILPVMVTVTSHMQTATTRPASAPLAQVNPAAHEDRPQLLDVVNHHISKKTAAAISLIGTGLWATFLVATLMKFDFRDELDHMDLLKSLPLSPHAIALGEIAAPAVVMTGLHVLLLLAMLLTNLARPQMLIGIFLLLLPFNVMMFALENLLFLLFPSRVNAMGVGDMQLFGRQVLIFVGKLLALMLAITIAAISGVAVGLITHHPVLTFATVWIVFCAESAALIPVVAWAFKSFDPSRDG